MKLLIQARALADAEYARTLQDDLDGWGHQNLGSLPSVLAESSSKPSGMGGGASPGSSHQRLSQSDLLGSMERLLDTCTHSQFVKLSFLFLIHLFSCSVPIR